MLGTPVDTTCSFIPDIGGLPGDMIIISILVVVLFILVIMLDSYIFRITEVRRALTRERRLTDKVKAGYDEAMAEVEALTSRLKQYEKGGDRTGHAVQPLTYSDDISYGQVESVPGYGEEMESSVMYEMDEEEEAPMDPRLAMALGSSIMDEVVESKRKKKESKKMKKEKMATEAVLDRDREETLRILDVFLIYKDGRVIYHLSKKIRLVDHSEQVGAMITALQMFIKQSLERDQAGVMNEMRTERMTIMMEYGEFANIAVVVQGRGSKILRLRMKNALDEIHEAHEDVLRNWDGKLHRLGKEEGIIREHIVSEYEPEEFHDGSVTILDLSDAETAKTMSGKDR